MPEKELKKVKAIMEKMGYSDADLLIKRFGEYRVILLYSADEPYVKYQGLPYYVLWKDSEVRPATLDERWELVGIE